MKNLKKEVRVNEVKTGQKFKNLSPVAGTNTYKCLGPIKKYIKGEYSMDVEIASTTNTEWNTVGEKTTIFFRPKHNRFKKVQIV